MESKEETRGVKSTLQMEHIVFDRINFQREGFRQADKEITFRILVAVDAKPDEISTVSLTVEAKKEGEYTALVKATGYFRFIGDKSDSDDLLHKNAVAVLFPFVRSELSLLTAQPETEPLVFPVLDINAVVEQARQEQQAKE